MRRIIIVGGYGAFGARAAERLAADPDAQVVIAGRSAEKARAFAQSLSGRCGRQLGHAAFDAELAVPAVLADLGAFLVINAAGPFQERDYRLARACAAARCHYVDLADARGFVTGIGTLDDEARRAGVALISGASSVPGISSAVAEDLARDMDRLLEVHVGISPGNSFDPGIATARAIIGAAGKPFVKRRGGRRVVDYGWQGLSRHHFAGLGRRWMSAVEVPDLDLLPQRWPQLATAEFTAGLEVGAFHLGLWAASWAVRARVVKDLRPLAGPMLAMKRRLSRLGSDAGGMFVRLAGVGRDGRPLEREWTLIARSGHGPYVPAMPAVILAKALLAGAGPPAGGRPCFALFTRQTFEAEIADLDISCTLQG